MTNVYREQDAERVIILKSTDGGLTWVPDETGGGSGGGGGAPTDATYLTATANASLSNEVVVGATPNGELGGTWGAITVNATHSGSSHAAVQAAAEATAANATNLTSGTVNIARLPIDADVATLSLPSNVTISAFGKTLVGAADATAANSSLGLGAAALIGTPISIANGGTGQTAKAAAFNALSPLTNIGDIIVYEAGANVRYGVGTLEAGKALTNQGAGVKAVWGNPQSIADYNGPTAAFGATTYDRAVHIEGDFVGPASGTLVLQRIFLPTGLIISNIAFMSGATAGSVLTNQWFGLFDSTGNKLVVTVNDGATAWPANTIKSLAAGSSYTTTYSGWYYVGICVTATTRPSLVAITGLAQATIRGVEPFPCRVSSTALTTPASCPNPVALGAAQAVLRYAEVY